MALIIEEKEVYAFELNGLLFIVSLKTWIPFGFSN